MENKVYVFVAGNVGTGKSTVATLINNYLISMGIPSELIDDDTFEFTDAMLGTCLHSIIDKNTTAVIKTVQLNRNAKDVLEKVINVAKTLK